MDMLLCGINNLNKLDDISNLDDISVNLNDIMGDLDYSNNINELNMLNMYNKKNSHNVLKNNEHISIYQFLLVIYDLIKDSTRHGIVDELIYTILNSNKNKSILNKIKNFLKNNYFGNDKILNVILVYLILINKNDVSLLLISNKVHALNNIITHITHHQKILHYKINTFISNTKQFLKLKKKYEKELEEKRANIKQALNTIPLNKKCAICLNYPKTHIIVPCGHKCVCGDCKDKIKDSCPICRQQIETIIKVFE